MVGRASADDVGFQSTAERLVNRNNSNLLTLFIDDANFWDADLTIGSWTSGDWRTSVKWSTGDGRLPPYFFFGPLLTIGVFGVAFVLLPPFFDISYLPFRLKLADSRSANQV